MKSQVGVAAARRCLIAILAFQVVPALGEITNTSGGATGTVIQYNGVVEVQRDFSQESVPETKAGPPATARARLDHLAASGAVTAAGQVVSLFDAANPVGLGTPNDAGIDIGAFSDDDVTSWFVQGTVNQTRTIVLRQGEIGGGLGAGNRGRVRSRLVLSGLMLILSSHAQQNLSETEVRFRFQVLRSAAGQEAVEVLAGSLALVGQPGGTVELQRGSGALANAFLFVVDSPVVIPELPLVKAVPFTGLVIPYEYEAVAGQPFNLELSVEAQVQVKPGGVGAAAVFGMPQEGLASVFARVKQSDAANTLAEAMARVVDTTGRAYLNGGGSFGLPLSGFCGVMGLETAAVLLTGGGGLMLARRNRRRRLGE